MRHLCFSPLLTGHIKKRGHGHSQSNAIDTSWIEEIRVLAEDLDTAHAVKAFSHSSNCVDVAPIPLITQLSGGDKNAEFAFHVINPTFFRDTDDLLVRYSNAHQFVSELPSTDFRASILVKTDMHFNNFTLWSTNLLPMLGACNKGIEDP
jgi:hypothetical protein